MTEQKTKQKDLEQTIALAFENTNATLPEDKYFNKIWNSIETRAPIGEKYYLRSFFSVFFFLLFFVLFILFYMEFLSTVLTLKDIRQQNTPVFPSVAPSLHPFYTLTGKEYKQVKMAGGIIVSSMEKSLFQVKTESTDTIQWDFFSGHIIVEKSDSHKILIIHLPDMTLSLRLGRFNLFCYDNIIRIIPLAHPLIVEINREKLSIKPGETFYLLNKKAVIY